MPEICRFYGILIRMYYNEHNPPHFHAQYGSAKAEIEISSMAVVAGSLPPRAQKLVMEWGELHREELLQNWKRARQREVLEPIEPLQ